MSWFLPWIPGKFITFARRGFQEHNSFRDLHHVDHLKWSDKLAIQAQKLAYRMALKGTIQVPGIDVFGENRAKLSAVNFDCETAGEEATKIWYNQGNNYSYADPRLNSNTDSFTQVIWKGTRDVGMGCAQRKGTLSNEIFVVALYYPPGNSPRALRQNVVSPNRNVNNAYSSIFRRRNQMYTAKRALSSLTRGKIQQHLRMQKAWRQWLDVLEINMTLFSEVFKAQAEQEFRRELTIVQTLGRIWPETLMRTWWHS